MDDRRAMALSAVCCATRVIAEGIAMLPLDMREHVNDRETRTAYEHPLWSVLHDQPNPEMDKFMFFDMQIPLQVNAGDAYAEKQRDTAGNIVALWPIHRDRVRIRYGPILDRDGEVLGKDGGRVYMVRSEDGTSYGIEARDMLHVPGAMSLDGINGRGLVSVAAKALGVIESTEEHVEAFYENGATPDVVISFKGQIPAEEKQNLRASWSKNHAGAKNAHKMLLLGGEPSVEQLGINPKDALLIDGRKFGVAEVSRFWRVPLHFLSELDRATMNNIEVLGIDFITFTLGSWIARWEQAMKRQLLTPEERLRYSFKFNVNALMRGDSAARSQYYQRMFDMGMMSINEGRELEDMNPIEGGDRYFILASNRVPLDRIDDVAMLNPSGASAAATAGDEPKADDEPAADAGKEPQSGESQTDEAQAAEAGTVNIQATALNGAQITALVMVADKLSLGELPKEGARSLIQAAFPATDRKLIDVIVDDVARLAEERKKEREKNPPPITNGQASAFASEMAGSVEAVIANTIAGLIGYEARAVVQKAEHPKFDAWCDEFYATKFRETFRSQLGPLLESARPFGASQSIDELADEHVKASKHSVLGLYRKMQDSPMSAFVASVKATVDGWSARAAVEAAGVFGKTAFSKDATDE